jgi:hypothetical protein
MLLRFREQILEQLGQLNYFKHRIKRQAVAIYTFQLLLRVTFQKHFSSLQPF